MPDQDDGELTIDYASMVENASDMIVRFDTEFRHIFCNKTVERQLGVPREFFLGKTPRELGSPSEQIEFITQSLQKTIESGEEQDVDGILKENIGRVYAMAEIHENLHRSDKLTEINFRPYVQKLTQMLSQTYSVDSKKVAFQVDTPELKLSIDKANPVGLVLNEMISNSLKYAFSDGQKGTISIKSRMLDGDIIELVVADDGVGIAEGIDWEKLDTLGLNLIQNLVRNQLNGSIDLDTTNGTKFTIKFNIKSNYKS